ncbi:MAG: tandem-95 repeat protein, partial [Piscinibacter sp.]|uniref:tandem-95 repeat protein n=1 Tax=Piscinibacter sp. TaxID=1903157 RepID=UPI003D0C35B8
MPVIARSPEGKVVSLWGTALIRGADGKLRLLKVGDIVRKGDQILTTQDGIVQIDNGEAPVRAADGKAPAAADDVEQAISALNRGDRDAAPAAGLAGGGGDGSMQEGLRVDRIAEGVGGGEVPRSTGDAELRAFTNDTGTSSEAARNQTGSSLPPLDVPSSAISSAEEGAPANLGLPVPTGAAAGGTIRVDQVPAVGEIRKADGTLVTAGTVLTPADLPGLSYVPPADYDGTVPAGSFTYTLTTDDGRSSTGATVITLSPVNDAPVATPGAGRGDEDAGLPVSLGGTDVDGRIVGVTVTALPAGGTLWLANGITPVAAGQVLTPTDAANLIYRPGADFNGDQTILFTVTDNGGATSAPAAIALTVLAVNDLPQASPASGGSGNEDSPIAVNLSGTDVDGTVTAVTVTILPVNGTLYLADGVTPVVAGTPLTPGQAAGLVFVPAPNYNGATSIAFTVTDDEGGTSQPGNAQITVAPVNDAPVAADDSARAVGTAPVRIDVLANDSDPDGDALSVASATVDPALGAVLVNPDGSLNFAAAPGVTGPVTVSYTIVDAAG